MEEKKDCGCGKNKEASGNCVMPTINFTTFIMSLNTSALFHLGEIPDPSTGERKYDKELARHTIDTLVMLEEKTKGNLNIEEAGMLKDILFDVKMSFVNSTK
ncbi:MAG: DUF1844 domain-containing protein [Desulfotalea sp.]